MLLFMARTLAEKEHTDLFACLLYAPGLRKKYVFCHSGKDGSPFQEKDQLPEAQVEMELHERRILINCRPQPCAEIDSPSLA